MSGPRPWGAVAMATHPVSRTMSLTRKTALRASLRVLGKATESTKGFLLMWLSSGGQNKARHLLSGPCLYVGLRQRPQSTVPSLLAEASFLHNRVYCNFGLAPFYRCKVNKREGARRLKRSLRAQRLQIMGRWALLLSVL